MQAMNWALAAVLCLKWLCWWVPRSPDFWRTARVYSPALNSGNNRQKLLSAPPKRSRTHSEDAKKRQRPSGRMPWWKQKTKFINSVLKRKKKSKTDALKSADRNTGFSRKRKIWTKRQIIWTGRKNPQAASEKCRQEAGRGGRSQEQPAERTGTHFRTDTGSGKGIYPEHAGQRTGARKGCEDLLL